MMPWDDVRDMHRVNIDDAPHFIKMMSYALKDAGTIDQFEEDYNCKLVYDEIGKITNINFINESCKTAFYLRYSGK